MRAYKYIWIAPSLGLLQRSNLQRVCVSAVMALALGCPISQEHRFALVKLPFEIVISCLAAAMHIMKGKLIGVPDPAGTQGTCGVPLDLYHSDSDPEAWCKLCNCLLRYAKGFFSPCLCALAYHSNLSGG